MKRIALFVLVFGLLFFSCDNGNGGGEITSSSYAGTWENTTYQVEMILAKDLSFEFKQMDGGIWKNIAKGTLSIENSDVTFTVTHIWIAATSTWSDDPSDLESAKGFFGGSLVLTGTVNGTTAGSVMDFSSSGAANMTKK